QEQCQRGKCAKQNHRKTLRRHRLSSDLLHGLYGVYRLILPGTGDSVFDRWHDCSDWKGRADHNCRSGKAFRSRDPLIWNLIERIVRLSLSVRLFVAQAPMSHVADDTDNATRTPRRSPTKCYGLAKRILSQEISAGENVVDCSDARSEEHTSELQSRGHLVCRLLLEKK